MSLNKNLEYYLSLPWTKVLKKNSDGTYFAMIQELKGCMTEGDNEEDALKMIKDALKAWLECALDSDFTIPEPAIAEENMDKEYSGRFNVRVPKSLHKKLAELAKDDNVSLNQYIVFSLTSHIAIKFSEQESYLFPYNNFVTNKAFYSRSLNPLQCSNWSNMSDLTNKIINGPSKPDPKDVEIELKKLNSSNEG